MGLKKRVRKQRKVEPRGLSPGAAAQPRGEPELTEDERNLLRAAKAAIMFGLFPTGLLNVAWRAESEVREYVWSKKLGKPAPRSFRIAELLEHVPQPEDLPAVIRDVPAALHAPSVIKILTQLRFWERRPTETGGYGLPDLPVYVTSAPAEALPKVLRRYASPNRARRLLLARIGRAIAKVQPELSAVKAARDAELRRVSRLVEERQRATGSKKQALAEVAKTLGVRSGKALDVMLRAWRKTEEESPPA